MTSWSDMCEVLGELFKRFCIVQSIGYVKSLPIKKVINSSAYVIVKPAKECTRETTITTVYYIATVCIAGSGRLHISCRELLK